MLRDERLETSQSLFSVLDWDRPLSDVLLEEAVKVEDLVRHILDVLRTIEHELAIDLRETHFIVFQRPIDGGGGRLVRANVKREKLNKMLEYMCSESFDWRPTAAKFKVVKNGGVGPSSANATAKKGKTYSIQVGDGSRKESSAIECSLEAVVADQLFVPRSDLTLEMLGSKVSAIGLYLVGLPDDAFLRVREPPEARVLGAMNDLFEALIDLGRRHGVLQRIQVLEGFDFHHHFGDHSERSKATKSGFKKRIVYVRLRAFYDLTETIDQLDACDVSR